MRKLRFSQADFKQILKANREQSCALFFFPRYYKNYLSFQHFMIILTYQEILLETRTAELSSKTHRPWRSWCPATRHRPIWDLMSQFRSWKKFLSFSDFAAECSFAK